MTSPPTKAAALVVLLAVSLVGCTKCEQRFNPGDIVKHRMLVAAPMLVVSSSEIENLDGQCLVTVRDGRGYLINLASVELELAP
ncbi:hypothetical protein NKH72_24305 [Mesorhizobium sp. M0955]|uniref:hypothetical protein n=1 Tax=Mesorhizobium sp. M0955 TaxID=2957033 RepID=UPI00333748A4